jgi:S-formylglutathione hydrolase
MSVEQVSTSTIFGGQQLRFKHNSSVLGCEMNFSVYMPPQAKHAKVPVIYWLSGLTCNDENFVQKAGAQQYAAEYGVAIVCPDTSPRGDDVPDDAEKAWDFGIAAGFYVNATQEPWSKHYHMYDYITQELPGVIDASDLAVDVDNAAIMGHSMGGHGALTIALKNPGKYKSVSAFAPICSPLNCPWGEKALGNYIGDNKADWEQYDACALISKAKEKLHILVDQGQADGFLTEQLKPELLQQACLDAKHPLTLRLQAGYDHSYFFIATFIEDHIAHHAEALWG